MSDYLNNLAAKNLNPMEVIRPRPVSLFEQLPAERGPIADHRPGLEIIDSEQVPGETTEFDAPSVPRRTLADLVIPLSIPDQKIHPQNEQQSDKLSAIPKEPPRKRQEHLSSQRSEELSNIPEQRPEELTDHLSSSRMPAETQTTDYSILEQSKQKGAALLEPVSWQKQGRDQQQLSPQGVFPQPKEIFSPDITETRHRPAFEPPVRELVTERIISVEKPPSSDLKTQTVSEQESPPLKQSLIPETSRRIAAQPQVRRYVEPSLLSSVKPKPAQESTPTIQVTIGRVEVRAMPPQAPPSKEQRSEPKSPVMSLDEYLHQRAKGGN